MEARYYKNFELAGEILRTRRPQIPSPRSYSPFLQNMDLDVLIQSGPDLFVRNNMGRLVLSVNMALGGTVAKLIPQGRVNVLEGRVYYSAKDFEITEGYLEYPGEAGKKPVLHISSRVQVRGEARDYLVFLTLDGPLDRITLSLSSIPELEREDILFVMLTGKTQNEYFSTTTSGTSDTARKLAFTGVSSLIGDDLRSWTGLDTFTMEGAEGKDFGVRATVGKHLNERIEVKGVLGFGSSREVNEAQVGYRLTDTLYLVGTQRSDGTFGLDIRVRLQGK
jgi:translocation and assembly module TamB